VLNTLLGKKAEVQELKAQLPAGHRAVAEWEEKKEEFKRASAKYQPKFEVAA
jgi:coatomer protein complex subunit epsilon